MEENEEEKKVETEVKAKKTRSTSSKKKNTNDRLSNILEKIEIEEEKKPKKKKETSVKKEKPKTVKKVSTTKKKDDKKVSTSKKTPVKNTSKVKEEKKDIEEPKKEIKIKSKEKTEKKTIKKEQEEVKNENVKQKKSKSLISYEEKRQEELEKIGEEIKKQKEIPLDVKDEINKRVFVNTLTAALIMLCLILINIGYKFVYIDNFVTALRVLSIGFIAITIVIFEIAYKKESGRLTINGIEMLALSVIVMLLPRLYYDLNSKFMIIVELISMFFAIYYEIKALIDYILIKRKVRKSDAKKIFVKK